MSEISSGLEEFFDYKNRLMEDLLTNETVRRLLSDDAETVTSPEALMYKQVFPFEYVPEVVEHGQTFICCEVDIESVRNKTFLNPTISIWIFTHTSKLRLPEGGVRTDKLASEIVGILNGSRMYGLGELELTNVRRFSPAAHYQGRKIVFATEDFNRLHRDSQKIPVNRKRG